MNNLEILLNLLIHPNYALRRKDKSWGLAIVVVIMATWSSVVSDYLMRGTSLNYTVFILSVILTITVVLFSVFVGVSLWHFISESFKGKGKTSELFLCICFSLLPYIFLAPMALVAKSLNVTFLWVLFQLFILVWVIVLQIDSIKTVYGLSGSQAVLTYFIPFAVLSFMLVFILVIAGIFVTLVASKMFMLL